MYDYRTPKSLKNCATHRLARALVDACKSLEGNPELVELPLSKVASTRSYLGRLAPSAYQDVFDLCMQEIRRRDCKGCFLELLVLPTLAHFHYEATNVDLMRTICVSQVLKEMRGLENFRLKITWIPDESIELVLGGITQGFEKMKRLTKVDLVGFDLPITAIVFQLTENCHRTLREFCYQDLEAQGRALDATVLRGLSVCKKLKVLDFKGIPVTMTCLDLAQTLPDIEYLGVTFDNPELVRNYLKLKPDFKLPLKRLVMAEAMKPEARDLSTALPNVDDVALISSQKQDLKWLQHFKKIRHLAVDFKSPTPAQVFDTLLRKAGKKMRTLKIRYTVGVDWCLLSDYCPSLRNVCFDHCSFVSLPGSIQVMISPSSSSGASHRSSQLTSSRPLSQSTASPRQIFFKNLTSLRLTNPEGREMPKMLKNVLEGSKKLENFVAALALNDKSVADLFPHLPDGEKDPNAPQITSLRLDSYVLTVAGLNTVLERLPKLQSVHCRASFQDNDLAELRRRFGTTALKDFTFVKNSSGGLYTQETTDFMGNPGF